MVRTPTPTATPVPQPPKVIYVVADLVNNGSFAGETVSAMQSSDGTSLWRTQFNYERSYTTPTVADGIVYVATDSFSSSTGISTGGIVHALRASDGTTLWTYSISNSIRGGASVYVADGIAYVTASPNGYSALYALQASTGKLLWQHKVDKEDFALPQSVANGVVYTGSYDFSNNRGNAYAFSTSDGSTLWKYQMPVDVNGYPQSAIVDKGVVYIASPQSYNRFQYPYDPSKDIQNTNSTVYALQANTGTLLWKYQIDRDSSFLKLEIADGILYASSASQKNSNGSVFALQASNGSLLWRYQVHVDNQYGGFNTAVINNGVVYIASQGTNAILYALKGSNGTQIWQHSLGSGYSPIMVPTNDTVYTGISLGTSSIDALQAGNGSLRWSYQLASGSDLSALIVTRTVLYVGVFGYNGPGSLFALQLGNGSLLRPAQQISISSIGF